MEQSIEGLITEAPDLERGMGSIKERIERIDAQMGRGMLRPAERARLLREKAMHEEYVRAISEPTQE